MAEISNEQISKCIGHNNFSFYGNKTEYGNEIMIMESGKAFVRLYIYLDDPDSIYIENLSVSHEYRQNKIATKLMEVIQVIAKEIEVKSIWLWVIWRKDLTWIHDWYIRIGFLDIKDHETEKDAVWMKKSLIK